MKDFIYKGDVYKIPPEILQMSKEELKAKLEEEKLRTILRMKKKKVDRELVLRNGTKIYF